MEDKLKDLFDHLDEKETDMLIKDIEVKDHGLNEDNIKKMVFEKLALETPKQPKKKVIHFSWKVYSIIATAACFALLIGTVIVPMVTNKEPASGTQIKVADADPQPNNDVDDVNKAENDSSKSYINNEVGGEQDIDESSSDKDTDISKNKDGKEGDNDSKDKKDEGKKPNVHRPGNSSDIAVGTNLDDLGTLSSDEVDAILSDSADEIDMDSFGAEFPSLNDMIKNSDYVIKGSKTASSLVSSEGADEYDLYAEFEVSNVLCNNTDADIKSVIKIKEGIKYNAESECYTHIRGYAYMKTGSEYILFINKMSKNKYELSGLLCGKVPCDIEEQEMCLDSDFVGNDSVKKIKGIISSARDKYTNNESAVAITPEPNTTASPSSASSTFAPSATPDYSGNNSTDNGKSDSARIEGGFSEVDE